MHSSISRLPAKSILYALPLLVAALLLGACDGSSNSDLFQEPVNTTVRSGYNTLFIGHSFFRPVAAGMSSHAERAGIEGHTQQVIFSGGASGSPQGLWEQASKRSQIQAILDAGDIELFGMTIHPDYPGLEGYTNWVNYALAQNPDTKFFIALPWPTRPETMDFDTYEARAIDSHPRFHSAIIDALRTAYPDNDFYCIPYSEGSVELYRLYDQGNLPEVDTLISSGGNLGIYKDQLGHPEAMLVDLSQLVWLQAIYNVDLSTYDYDPGYITDLKTIASDIMARHDSAYDDQ